MERAAEAAEAEAAARALHQEPMQKRVMELAELQTLAAKRRRMQLQAARAAAVPGCA